MYTFKDTTIQEYQDDVFRPTSAMNFNGVFLEDLIEGYQTLHVDGRETLNVDLATDSLSVGSTIYNSKLPSRVLTVHFKLAERNPEKLMISFRKLMNFLYSEENRMIWFNDERDIFYEGRYTSFSDVPGNVLSMMSSFQIYCENPIKQTIKTFETDGFIGVETPIKTYPNKIEVTIKNNSQLSITNKRDTIMMLPNSTKIGDVVIFDLIKGKIYINNVDKTNQHVIKSQFEYFELRQGDTITSNGQQLKIYYKGVTL